MLIPLQARRGVGILHTHSGSDAIRFRGRDVTLFLFKWGRQVCIFVCWVML